MKNLAFILAFVLVGCGGSPFTVGFNETETDGGHPLMVATGGASAGGSGGKANLGTGGAGTGGSESSGGAGGIVEADAGSGGKIATGGQGGSVAEADACVLTTHINGTGQMWQDCVPLATYNESQAMKACTAYCTVNGGCSCMSGACNSSSKAVRAVSGTQFIFWTWQGSHTGDVETAMILGTAGCVDGYSWR